MSEPIISVSGLRGIRRNQAETRRESKFIEWSDRYHCYAISPLLNWTGREIHAYMKQHDLPYHPLYDKGYASIGCNPLSCTRPIQPGEEAWVAPFLAATPGARLDGQTIHVDIAQP